jgi:hypothetical protein
MKPTPFTSRRAERRAAFNPAVRWRGQSPGLSASALTPLGDLPTYSSDEGHQ